MNTGIAAWHTAVSYTHLDVYKRQTLLLYGRNSLVLSSNEDVERVISMFGRMHRQSGKNAT